MDADGFVDLCDFFNRQFADKLNKTAFVDGSDLVGSDFGIFGKVGCAPGQKRFERIRFLCVFGGERDNTYRAGVNIVLFVGDNDHRPCFGNFPANGWIKGCQIDVASFNIHPIPPNQQAQIP